MLAAEIFFSLQRCPWNLTLRQSSFPTSGSATLATSCVFYCRKRGSTISAHRCFRGTHMRILIFYQTHESDGSLVNSGVGPPNFFSLFAFFIKSFFRLGDRRLKEERLTTNVLCDIASCYSTNCSTCESVSLSLRQQMRLMKTGTTFRGARHWTIGTP